MQFTKEEQELIDTRTVFFDVFLDRSSRRLRAIGPRLFNLKQEVFPLELFINDRAVQFRLDEIDRLVFLETETLTDQSSEPMEVEFCFKSFAEKARLGMFTDALIPREYCESPITITTLQKDNHFEWIRDWIRWHHRLHGIGRLILYDNGSSNRDDLILQLRTLEDEVRIIFVDWNFPHGVAPFKFAQFGSLNHARLLFPVRESYCVNLDIDEFLVKPGDGSLLQYLNQKLAKPSLGAIVFTQYLVPNVLENDRSGIPRFFDFRYRFRKHGTPGGGESWNAIRRMKYIYHFERIGYNAVHRTASEKNKEFSKRYGKIQKLRFYIKKSIRELFSKLIGDRFPKLRIDARHVSVDELFFFHFLGLNTGWRNDSTTERVSFDSEIHVEESLIMELAEKAGLLPAKED